ncbi:putative GCN5-related N-acetyltransferase [Desulfosarcina variabilis str. Montpellier]|uniref:GNAT family N-acetyltransferase n=1 Tax=Desulfosarcina variabilis TaxID=2300 RepID=UPI003AFA146C
MISIKPSTTENNDFIRKTHHLAYREMVQRQFGKWDQPQQEEFVNHDLLEDDHEIIFFGNEPCGYFSLSIIQGKIHLVNFAILPEHQSKGIGGLVIEKLKERSNKSKKPLSIGTFKTNLDAQRFYEKHELKRCGETDTHFIYEWPEKS